MSDEIVAGGAPQPIGTSRPTRRLVPMQVGRATVFVDLAVESPAVEVDDTVIAVTTPSPQEAFQMAADALQECVGAVGNRLKDLAAEAKPAEVTVEFTLTFEAKGRALLPIFVTAESGLSTGLKVTAKWRPEVPEQG